MSDTKIKIQPLGDRVLVKAVEAKEVRRGGIIIPDTAKEKPMEGKIVDNDSTSFDFLRSPRKSKEVESLSPIQPRKSRWKAK